MGRWAGEWKPAQGPARPISVTFAPGAPSAALAAEVTVGGVGRPRSVHRRAIVGGDAVRVGMPDGSQAVLRLVDGDLLVGEASRASLRLLRQSQ